MSFTRSQPTRAEVTAQADDVLLLGKSAELFVQIYYFYIKNRSILKASR